MSTNTPGEIPAELSDASALLPAPRYVLMEPAEAPGELLSLVGVNTELGCLDVDTELGKIALSLIWEMTEDSGDLQRAAFFKPLGQEVDPGAKDNPYTTQNLPYAILPNHALYRVVVGVPDGLVDDVPILADRNLNPDLKDMFGTGILLSDFKRVYKGVDTRDLPEGSYQIDAKEETKRTIAIAARIEDREPLVRRMSVFGDQTYYYEKYNVGAYKPDGFNRYLTYIDSRYTMHDDSDEAEDQRLEFVYNDGWQRTGERALITGGMVELILYSAVEYRQFDFKFSVPQQKLHLREVTDLSRLDNLSVSGQRMIFRGPDLSGRGEEPISLGGLVAGQTRFGKPRTIKASTVGIRNARPIAAFQFALAGQ